LVTGYEQYIDTLTCDPKDRHVLAAAIKAQATTIVTANLKDFPPASLAPYSIAAIHPDAFLSSLFVAYPVAIARLLEEQATTKTRPPQTVDQLLSTLRNHVPRFTALMRTALTQVEG